MASTQEWGRRGATDESKKPTDAELRRAHAEAFGGKGVISTGSTPGSGGATEDFVVGEGGGHAYKPNETETKAAAVLRQFAARRGAMEALLERRRMLESMDATGGLGAANTQGIANDIEAEGPRKPFNFATLGRGQPPPRAFY